VDVQNQVAIAQRPAAAASAAARDHGSPSAKPADPPRRVDPARTIRATTTLFVQLRDAPRLRRPGRVHGVGQVIVFGARDYGMRIWLDPAKMARPRCHHRSRHVSPNRTCGARRHRRRRAGTPGQQMQYVASVKGRLSTPEQYGNIVVRTGAEGASFTSRISPASSLAATDYRAPAG